MIDDILKASKSDAQLVRLLEKVREYTLVYLLAKQRQKGCDEMGEVATLKDEFRGVLDELIDYCKEKRYLTEDISFDINSVAKEIKRMTKILERKNRGRCQFRQLIK